MLPSVVAQSQKTAARSARVKKTVPRVKLTAPRTANAELAHRSSRPNFFYTKTFHRNAEDAPNAHGVAVQNAYCCVWQQRARLKKHAGPHTERHADSATDCCTQNIVPSEKWQLGHCAA